MCFKTFYLRLQQVFKFQLEEIEPFPNIYFELSKIDRYICTYIHEFKNLENIFVLLICTYVRTFKCIVCIIYYDMYVLTQPIKSLLLLLLVDFMKPYSMYVPVSRYDTYLQTCLPHCEPEAFLSAKHLI